VTVSTHVLDAVAGRPAAGVLVTLSRAASAAAGNWPELESGATDSDGRHRFGAATPPGVYRLSFGTGDYFAGRGTATFYPEVVITFTVADGGTGHYHVPLLLSPFAYSTYRGS
jgi:5-hydroxyisourate hydrolase